MNRNTLTGFSLISAAITLAVMFLAYDFGRETARRQMEPWLAEKDEKITALSGTVDRQKQELNIAEFLYAHLRKEWQDEVRKNAALSELQKRDDPLKVAYDEQQLLLEGREALAVFELRYDGVPTSDGTIDAKKAFVSPLPERRIAFQLKEDAEKRYTITWEKRPNGRFVFSDIQPYLQGK